MELTTLRNFLEVSKVGNITHAAQRLNITQPSLSRQIMLLEKELGQRLFLRKHHRVELTEAGKALQRRASEIIQLSDLTVAEIVSKHKQVEGELSIAFIDGAFSDTIPEVIDSFKRAYPGIRMNFYSGGLDYLNLLIKHLTPDIVCTFTGTGLDDLEYIKTDIAKRAGFIMYEDDPMAEYNEFTKDIYKTLPVIYPRGVVMDENGVDIDPGFLEEQIVAMVEEPLVFLDLIRRSRAYIFCLEPSTEVLRRYNLCFRPLVPQRRATLYFAKRPNKVPTPPMELFMNYIEQFYTPRTHK